MPYLGNPAQQRFSSPRAASVYSGDGSTVAFTLEEVVSTDEDILVSVDGVIQEPSVAYAVSSGTTLTFTAAPSNNAGNNIFVYYIARTFGSVSMPDGQNVNAAVGTFTGAFTSLGIDDNADATAITINSSENVSIGGTAFITASGEKSLTIGNGSTNPAITLYSATNTQGQISFGDAASGTGAYEGYLVYNHASNHMSFGTNHTEAMRISSIGAVTKPLQPAFSVKLTQDQANIATGTLVDVLYATEIFDQNNDFNHTNYTFTAPVTGKYQLNINLYINSVDSAADNYYIRLATSNRSYYNVIDPDFGQDNVAFPLGFSVIADMDADDTALVKIYQTGGTAQTDINANTYFTGCLLA